MSWSRFFIVFVNLILGVMNIYFTFLEYSSLGCFLRLMLGIFNIQNQRTWHEIKIGTHKKRMNFTHLS